MSMDFRTPLAALNPYMPCTPLSGDTEVEEMKISRSGYDRATGRETTEKHQMPARYGTAKIIGARGAFKLHGNYSLLG